MADDLTAICRRTRAAIVAMSHRAETPHLGSSLSCVEILVAALWKALHIDPVRPDDADRDRLILSKGHAASALYAALALRGYFPVQELETFAQPGSRLPEQPAPRCVPGVELATGSLGHGLPVGAGIALAGRLRAQPYRVCVVLSDGECNEGSVWEAAMFAAGQKLSNLKVVVDYNKWQATGRSDDILAIAPLKAKWEAFGWRASECDGHDLPALIKAIADFDGAQPTAIVAHTVKGKGISFMEDNNNWHYRSPNEEELGRALKELEVR